MKKNLTIMIIMLFGFILITGCSSDINTQVNTDTGSNNEPEVTNNVKEINNNDASDSIPRPPALPEE